MSPYVKVRFGQVLGFFTMFLYGREPGPTGRSKEHWEPLTVTNLTLLEPVT